MLMVSFDKDNVTPGSIAGQESGLWIRTIAYSGGTKKPFITITYTPADTTPPASITNLANVTNCSQINITFTKPADADYNGSMIWWNDAAQTNLTSTDTFKLFTGLIQNTAYTFASKTFDNATPANVNATFTNHTATTLTSVTASFTKNQTAGLQPLSVMFNDTSTGSSVNQWNWSFGDGTWQNGTTQNATKIYSSGGEYSIFLIGSNTCGSNTSASQTINVYNQTLSGFSANITEGLMPLSVMFSVTNSNDNASFWNWSFGDGTWQNGTSQNATYIYPTGGLYSVTEIAGNTWSSSTTTRTDYINVWNLTSISSFTANTTTGSAPLPVSFTDVSYNATNWYTEFGDGNTSVIKSPEFTYNIPGLYTVNHRAYSGYDSSWLNQTDYINVTVPVIAPVTGFSANATSGISSLAVGFTDSSTNTPTNWDWYFWPNETKSSDLQNPEQIFTIGLYDIRLYSSNSAGGDWENKTAYINVTAPPLAPPTAVFSGVPTSGNAPLLVTFTDASTNTPISWYWEFGEGNTSILQNPTNTYGSPGTYSVNLRATNADGFDWENKTNYITANISPTPTPTPTPIPVTPNVDRNKRIVDPITWVKNWFNDIRHVGE